MSDWRRHRLPLTAAAGLGVAALAVALLVLRTSGGALAASGVGAALAAALSLLAAGTRVAPARRGACRWLAAGAITWAAGTWGRTFLSPGEPPASVLSFADLFVLGAAVVFTVGSALTVGRSSGALTLARQLSDAYVCAGSLFSIGWVTLLGPLYERGGGLSADFLLAMALPLLFLCVTCWIGQGVAGAGPPRRPLAIAVLATMAALTASETFVAAAKLTGDPAPAAGAVPLLAAFLLLAVSPWVRRRRAEPREDRPPLATGVPLALAGVAIVVVSVWTATHGVRPWHGLPVLGLVGGSVMLILLVRLFVLTLRAARLRLLVDGAERRLRDLAETAGDVVLTVDHEGVIHHVSEGVLAMYGYRPEEVARRRVGEFVHPEDQPDVEAALRAFADDERSTCRLSCRVRAADGTWRPAEAVATRHVRTGGDELLLITTRDITDEMALRHQVTHLTFHDGITGLPNRAYFEERVRDLLDRHPSGVAVVFLDLDGFTAVNDSVGHAAGDYLLSQAARRLRRAVDVDDTLARFGGDEFAVLVEIGAEGQAAVVDLAELLVRTVSTEPFRVAGRDVALTASVGIAFAEEGLAHGELIRNADVAMARAKELGGHRVEVFAAHMHADVMRRLEMAADLQRALMENQFALEYQPVVDLATSRVTAVEALVRWWRGSAFVPPEDFLGVAEDTGLIVPLSEWILTEACREVAAWRASSWDIGLNVNLSPRQITSPRFVDTIAAALKESGLPPSALTLEVTEDLLVEDADERIERLSALRALGVRLAIDDFGTGYASLAYLRQLPVDMIKIDPSFVSGLGSDETLALLTRTIVRLGHDLGLVVVAEGIERPEQLEQLREMGCTRGQGYLVARPMAPRRVDTLMPPKLSGTLR
ncbi:putative bifunctional diguanylate cyclase/phosphodiesterase [Bailinhaonella thermotolerans]|uniref:EAL domain-containing protein n=1 Tax=Bailinhaonella thermotolerans TaxID=1070861 RepID=A0A3A4B0F1_9ACTN|nr:EAL domain-containing protein [Bailinhaonella thermotolerans]RJL25082.1 EAL domain-containing protein [Bailinhaonella thermotolerans]